MSIDKNSEVYKYIDRRLKEELLKEHQYALEMRFKTGEFPFEYSPQWKQACYWACFLSSITFTNVHIHVGVNAVFVKIDGYLYSFVKED